MSSRNIYLPPDLDMQVNFLNLNISAICQEALRIVVEQESQKCSRCHQALPSVTSPPLGVND